MTKVYKATVLVIDHDDIGPASVVGAFENTSYPNRCISPSVLAIEQAEVEWSDDHPLNQRHVDKHAEVRKLFPAVAPKVVINHDGDEPDVTVEPEGSVDIEFVDGVAEAQLIVEHEGVSVYQAEKDCTLSDYWVATAPHTYHENEEVFDIRDLDTFEGYPDLEKKYGELFPDNHEAQILAYNIDLGHITEDGYRQVNHGKAS